MSDYSPKPENKFTFGLWTVGNRGADPFGYAVREGKSPAWLLDGIALFHTDHNGIRQNQVWTQ